MAVITTSTRGPKGDTGTTGPTGETGETGAAGATSAAVIYSYDGTSNAGITANVATSLAGESFALNTIAIGDIIEVDATLDVSVMTGVKKVYLYMNGVVKQTLVPFFRMEEDILSVELELSALRVSDTELLCTFKGTFFNEYYQKVSEVTFTEKVTVLDMTSSTNTIFIFGSASGAGDRLYLRKLIFSKYKA